MYGKCIFNTYSSANVDLADEIYEAATINSQSADLAPPPRGQKLAEVESRYWSLMSKGTGFNYSYVPNEPPTVSSFRTWFEKIVKFCDETFAPSLVWYLSYASLRIYVLGVDM